MNELNSKEIMAMIALLDDPSDFIYDEILTKLKSYGTAIIPVLQKAYVAGVDSLKQERIKVLLDDMKISKLKDDLFEWVVKTPNDLLGACIMIAKFASPDLDEDEVLKVIDEISKRIDEQIVGLTTDSQMAQLMNNVILNEFNFKGNSENYSATENSFINKVIENRMGNPIMLSVIYLLVAQRLNLPIVGINSPGHFLLAYITSPFDLKDADIRDVARNFNFIIDPFNRGKIVSTMEYDQILTRMNFSPAGKHALIASNPMIIRRIMNNMIYGYKESGDQETAMRLYNMMEKFI